MTNRSKYSLNGVYKCENLAQYLENDNCPYSFIGYASGIPWEIRFKTKVKNDKTFVFPIIYSHHKPRAQVRTYFNIIRKDGSSCWENELKHVYMKSSEGCVGKFMDVEKLLDENNGYLDEGALTVEYGFQVESEEGEDGIWMFNFYDKYFNWQNQDNTFLLVIEDEGALFGHKQILKLHSKTVSGSNKVWIDVPGSFWDLHLCLQIAHGVRLPVVAGRFETTIGFAFLFGFSNTVKYCDQQLIEMDESTKLKDYYFRFAVQHDLRRYLIHLLKQIKTKKQLINFLSIMDLEKMSSESMKAIVTKIFSL